MKISVSDVNETQKKLIVEIPADVVQPEIDKKYRQLSKRVRIKGFRPGKAPRNVLKAYYGKAIDNEVAQEFIEKTFPDALEQEGIKPLAEADLENYGYNENGSLTYSVLVEVAPEFEPDGYKGIEIRKPPEKAVTEEDIENELTRIAESSANLEPVEDGEVQEGHVVTIDVTPYIDGRVDEKYVQEDLLLEIGKDKLYHPEFGKQLLGAKVGDTVHFKLKYLSSEEAPNEDWVGKEVEFYVDIKNIARKELPEINDEFAKTLGLDSLEKLREEVRKRLEKELELESKKFIREQIDSHLLKSNDIPVPEKAVLQEMESEIKDIEMQLLRQGIDHKIEDPKIRESFKPGAELSVKLRIIIDKIAEKENITLSPQEEEEVFSNLAQVLRVSTEEAKERFEKSSLLDKMKANKIREKVYEFIEEHAKFVDASEVEDSSQETANNEKGEEDN